MSPLLMAALSAGADVSIRFKRTGWFASAFLWAGGRYWDWGGWGATPDAALAALDAEIARDFRVRSRASQAEASP